MSSFDPNFFHKLSDFQSKFNQLSICWHCNWRQISRNELVGNQIPLWQSISKQIWTSSDWRIMPSKHIGNGSVWVCWLVLLFEPQHQISIRQYLSSMSHPLLVWCYNNYFQFSYRHTARTKAEKCLKREYVWFLSLYLHVLYRILCSNDPYSINWFVLYFKFQTKKNQPPIDTTTQKVFIFIEFQIVHHICIIIQNPLYNLSFTHFQYFVSFPPVFFCPQMFFVLLIFNAVRSVFCCRFSFISISGMPLLENCIT